MGNRGVPLGLSTLMASLIEKEHPIGPFQEILSESVTSYEEGFRQGRDWPNKHQKQKEDQSTDPKLKDSGSKYAPTILPSSHITGICFKMLVRNIEA